NSLARLLGQLHSQAHRNPFLEASSQRAKIRLPRRPPPPDRPRHLHRQQILRPPPPPPLPARLPRPPLIAPHFSTLPRFNAYTLSLLSFSCFSSPVAPGTQSVPASWVSRLQTSQ